MNQHVECAAEQSCISSLNICSPIRSIENALLARELQKQLGMECRINAQQQRIPPASLVLFDCREMSAQKIHLWLQHLHSRNHARLYALFNTALNSLHERLVEWPCLQGIFYENTSHQTLGTGLERIIKGELALPQHLWQPLFTRRRQPPKHATFLLPPVQLTRREQQVLEGVYAGHSNQAIAHQLALSEHTIKSHLYTAYKKLGVRSRLEAGNWMRDYQHMLAEKTAFYEVTGSR